MRKCLGAAAIALLPLSAISAHAQTIADDPWGPLDDMVGKRYEQRYPDPDTPVFEFEYRWEIPGQVIREELVSIIDRDSRSEGGGSFSLYELDASTGEVIKRVGSASAAPDVRYAVRASGLVREQRSASGSQNFFTLRVGEDGQIGEFFSSKRDAFAPETPARLSSRYVEVGSAWVDRSNELEDPAKWGPLASLANRTLVFEDHPLHLRVSDDGRFIELIEVGPDKGELFGLLRAEGGGHFRLIQLGFNLMDHIHEGRMAGDTLVLPSLVEPGYEVSIRVYDEPPLGLTLRAEAYGSPSQSWLAKGWLQPNVAIEQSSMAAALEVSEEQRAHFDEYFTPTSLQLAMQKARDVRAETERRIADAKMIEERMAAIDARIEAENAEFDAMMQANRSPGGAGTANVLGAFLDGFSGATAANQAMRQSMDDAINRGLAEGAIQYARRESARSYADSSRAYNSSGGFASGGTDPRRGSTGSAGARTTEVSSPGPSGDKAMSARNVRVWLRMPMEATDSNTLNPLCISSTFSVNILFDPKGWGNPGRMNEAIDPLESIFIAKCSRHGRPSGGMRWVAEGISSDFESKPQHPQFYYVSM